MVKKEFIPQVWTLAKQSTSLEKITKQFGIRLENPFEERWKNGKDRAASGRNKFTCKVIFTQAIPPGFERSYRSKARFRNPQLVRKVLSNRLAY